jgi:hypothetical protein
MQKEESIKMLLWWGGELDLDVIRALAANLELKEALEKYDAAINNCFKRFAKVPELSEKFIKKLLLFRRWGAQFNKVSRILLEEFIKYKNDVVEKNANQLDTQAYPLITTLKQINEFQTGINILLRDRLPRELQVRILGFRVESDFVDIIKTYASNYADCAPKIARFYLDKRHYPWNELFLQEAAPNSLSSDRASMGL